jgi:hypothetical protein
MGGVWVSTHSSLALAWTWDAVTARTRGCSPRHDDTASRLANGRAKEMRKY